MPSDGLIYPANEHTLEYVFFTGKGSAFVPGFNDLTRGGPPEATDIRGVLKANVAGFC